jgi:excisionase family DNA binding protein
MCLKKPGGSSCFLLLISIFYTDFHRIKSVDDTCLILTPTRIYLTANEFSDNQLTEMADIQIGKWNSLKKWMLRMSAKKTAKSERRTSRGRRKVDTNSWFENQAVLNTSEACKYLRISRPTFLKLIGEGRIRAQKIGRGWKVLRTELDRFLTSG